MILMYFIASDHESNWASLVAQSVKNPPAMQETWVWSLSWEDPLKEILQYSCLGNPIDRGAWRATVQGVARVRDDLATKPPPPREELLMVTFCSLVSYIHQLAFFVRRSCFSSFIYLLMQSFIFLSCLFYSEAHNLILSLFTLYF